MFLKVCISPSFDLLIFFIWTTERSSQYHSIFYATFYSEISMNPYFPSILYFWRGNTSVWNTNILLKFRSQNIISEKFKVDQAFVFWLWNYDICLFFAVHSFRYGLRVLNMFETQKICSKSQFWPFLQKNRVLHLIRKHVLILRIGLLHYSNFPEF